MCEERKEQCTTEEWEVAARERKDEACAAWFTCAKTRVYAEVRHERRRRPGIEASDIVFKFLGLSGVHRVGHLVLITYPSSDVTAE